MGVHAYLHEITQGELSACQADLAAADRILDDPKKGLKDRASCSLDKAWGGLHFLFVQGKYDIEAAAIDFERAPKHGDYAIVLSDPKTVVTLSDNFSWKGREEHLAEFYAPTKMRGIYPDIWERDGKDALDYLLSFIPGLRAFFASVAESGNAVLASLR